MSALVSSLLVVWLVPVRGDGPVAHLAPRAPGPDFGPVHGAAALCGAVGRVDHFGRHRWTRVRSAARTQCMTCFAAACDAKKPARVDWG